MIDGLQDDAHVELPWQQTEGHEAGGDHRGAKAFPGEDPLNVEHTIHRSRSAAATSGLTSAASSARRSYEAAIGSSPTASETAGCM